MIYHEELTVNLGKILLQTKAKFGRSCGE